FRALGDDPGAALRRLYIEDNPRDATERHLFVMADDGSAYSRLHGLHHPWLETLVTLRDYYDLFLVDRHGDIVYSVFKEGDLGTSLIDGPYADTPLAEVWRRAAEAAPGAVVASDFAR